MGAISAATGASAGAAQVSIQRKSSEQAEKVAANLIEGVKETPAPADAPKDVGAKIDLEA